MLLIHTHLVVTHYAAHVVKKVNLSSTIIRRLYLFGHNIMHLPKTGRLFF